MIETGRVRIDGQPVKPARAVRPGLVIELRRGRSRRRIEVLDLSETRGPAPQALALYRDLDPLAAGRHLRRRGLKAHPARNW